MVRGAATVTTESNGKEGGSNASLYLIVRKSHILRDKGDVVVNRRTKQLIVRVLEVDPDPSAYIPNGLLCDDNPCDGDSAGCG